MYKLLKFIIIMTAATTSLVAQDLHFSQYYNSPLTLNPTQTGDFDGDWRLSANYRTQWSAVANSPYVTYSFGFDKPEYLYTEKISWGVIAIRDESFMNLNTTQLMGSVAYGREIKKNTLSFGLQFGVVDKRTDFSDYTFDSQFDLGGGSVFNTDFSNDESADNGLTYFDLNAGLQWRKQLSKKFIPEAGIAFSHLTRPSGSFTGLKSDATKLPIKTSVHGGGKFKASERLTLHPHVLYSQQKGATDWMLGGNAEIHIKHEIFKSVYGGTLFRYGWSQNYDATIWIIGTKFNNFDLGFSYDINLSSLNEATNYRGAFEVSLIYITSSTKPDKIQIPCDRF